MEFEEFAASAAEVEAASADTEIVALVADLLADAGEDLPVVARFLQGRVFPAWSPDALDVGPALCYEAIARAAGPDVTAADVEARVAETGDVGAAAASFEFGGQRGLAAFGGGAGGSDGGVGSLTVAGVDEELRRLAAAEGGGSEGRKRDALFGLFNRCSPAEARYLARLVLAEMRIGVGEGTVRDATAAAFDVSVDAVERALQVTNDYGEVAVVARAGGEAGLADLHLEVGRPVQAMLAQAGTVEEAVESWETVAVEWKLDGARVQVHYERRDGGDDGSDRRDRRGDGSDRRDVSVFSRNMEDVTDALPEVVAFVEASCEPPAILDGEVVAVDDEGDPLPFQEVLRRFRRKHDVERVREEVPVEFSAFDCLHAPASDPGAESAGGGEDLLGAPLRERRERLESVFAAGCSEFRLTDDPEEIAAVERDALAAGHEGIVLKDPDSAYTPGRRGKQWLKRKPDVETLDLVVTGAEWGEGRRANLLGTFEVAARAADGDATGTYQPVGKVATGVTDEQLAELTELLEPYVRAEAGMDVEIEPAVVFEVGYEEIQSSPKYASGYALRFPRFVAVREDKDPVDADPVERIRRLVEER